MKKFGSYFFCMLIVFLLAACNIPRAPAQPTADLVATQVAKFLTEQPTQTEAPPTLTPIPPTNTPEMTATATETATPTATETANASDPVTQLGAPAWIDDFNTAGSKWIYKDDQSNFDIKQGYLHITSMTTANWHSWYVTSPKVQNAYLEMTAEYQTCAGNDRLGLAFRSPDGTQFYYMGVTCEGQWGFFRMTKDVTILEIKPYQPATAFKTGVGQVNRIGVWMKGSTFSFYINGIKVGEATDSTLGESGYIGFMIAHSKTNGFTVKVDQLAYWSLP